MFNANQRTWLEQGHEFLSTQVHVLIHSLFQHYGIRALGNFPTFIATEIFIFYFLFLLFVYFLIAWPSLPTNTMSFLSIPQFLLFYLLFSFLPLIMSETSKVTSTFPVLTSTPDCQHQRIPKPSGIVSIEWSKLSSLVATSEKVLEMQREIGSPDLSKTEQRWSRFGAWDEVDFMIMSWLLHIHIY